MPTPKKPDEPAGEVVPETTAPVPAPSTRYRFTYRDITVYPEFGVTAEPGDVHDWPDGPPTDGRWTLADEKE